MMFMGGLMVAAVIEHSQLHRRIALSILRLMGTNPRLLMLGKTSAIDSAVVGDEREDDMLPFCRFHDTVVVPVDVDQ